VNRICFIPARDSSTRLKNKNIASFGTGNLITNTIEQAQATFLFDRIILSSNSESILEIALDYEDVEVHKRDDSQDTLIGVLRQAIPDLNVKPNDDLTLLPVTCPLRYPLDIFEGICVFLNDDRKYCVVSVKKNENPIHMSFTTDVGGHLQPVFPNHFMASTRKQDHPDTYFFNDAFIIDTVERWIDEKRPTLYGHDPIPYLMPPERSIAIDYEFQLNIVRALWEASWQNLKG